MGPIVCAPWWFLLCPHVYELFVHLWSAVVCLLGLFICSYVFNIYASSNVAEHTRGIQRINKPWREMCI